MFRLYATIILFLLMTGQAFADTHAAADCTHEVVQAAIDASSDGDTVTIPAGACTWDTAVNVDKTINVIGAGKLLLTITRGGSNYSYAMNVTADGVRISGIAFYTTNYKLWGIYVNGVQDVRIDNCKFECTDEVNTNVYAINYYGDAGDLPRGLVDNCEFINAKVTVHGGSSNAVIAARWYEATTLGTANNVFVEDCTFTRNSDSTHPSNVGDNGYGGTFVARFNTLTGNTNFMTHSLQQGTIRGGKNWEYYGNSHDTDQKGTSSFFMYGGTGVIFDNTITDTLSYSHPITFTLTRETTDVTSPIIDGEASGLCDGDSNWDMNDSGGWPCRDQIGTGSDTELWGLTMPIPDQNLAPVYTWNNTDDGVNSPAYEDKTNISANRDYYDYNASFDGTTGVGRGLKADMPATCTTGVGYWVTDEADWNSDVVGNDGQLYTCSTTDTWTLFYTPYAYPHPRIAVDAGAPATPWDVTVWITGAGAGTITSTGGLNFTSGYDTDKIDEGDNDVITAVPTVPYYSGNWGGDCSGSMETPCTLTNITANKTVYANFIASPQLLYGGTLTGATITTGTETVGYQTIGETSYNTYNSRIYTTPPYTVSNTGTIHSIYLYSINSSATVDMEVGVYKGATLATATLLGKKTFNNPGVWEVGWKEFDVSSEAWAVTAGDVIRVGYITNLASQVYVYGATTGNNSAYLSKAYANPWPDPYGAGSQAQTSEKNVKVTITY